jgi:WD40 repeat protein
MSKQSEMGEVIYEKSDQRPISIVFHPALKNVLAITRDGKLIVPAIGTGASQPDEINIGDENLDFLGIVNQDYFVVSGEGIKIIDKSFKVCKIFKLHEDTIIGVAVIGDSIYSASEDCSVIETNKITNVSKTLYKHNSPIISFDFSKSSNLIATTCSDSELIIFNLKTKNIQKKINLDHKIWSLKFSLNGDLLFAGDHDGSLTIYKSSDLSIHKKSKSIHESRIKHLNLSPDGEFLVTSSFDTKVKVLKSDSLEEVKSHDLHCDWVRSATFDSDSQVVYSCGDDGKIIKFRFREAEQKSKENWMNYIFLLILMFSFLLILYFLFFSCGKTNESLTETDSQPIQTSYENSTQVSNHTFEGDIKKDIEKNIDLVEIAGNNPNDKSDETTKNLMGDGKENSLETEGTSSENENNGAQQEGSLSGEKTNLNEQNDYL